MSNSKHMIPYKYNENKALEELKEYIDKTLMKITVGISFKPQSSLLTVDMAKDFVSVTYSSMHNDMEKRMARIERTCLR